jgi:cysteine dioxygenase
MGMIMRNQKKGIFVVEQGIAVSEFIEKINKLSYQEFPAQEVEQVLKKSELSLELLEPYIFFSDVRYTRNLIYKSPKSDFEIMVHCWKPGQHSAIHQLKSKIYLFKVINGVLEKNDYQKAKDLNCLLKRVNEKDVKGGCIASLNAIHSLKNNTNKNVVSLHLYIDPLFEYSIYDLEVSQMKKISLGYHSIHGKLVVDEST